MSQTDNEAHGQRHGKFLVMDSAQMTVTSAVSFFTEQSLPECDVNSCNGDSSVQNTITKDKNNVYFFTQHEPGNGVANNSKSVTLDTNGMPTERRSMLRDPTPNGEHFDANFQERQKKWKKNGDAALIAMISALYGKILVVMGLALPMSEVISSQVTSTSYVGFYLYLYLGSIFYLAYVFISLIREKSAIRESMYPPPTPNTKRALNWLHRRSKDSGSCKDVELADMPLTPTETPPPGVPISFTRIRHRTMSQELRDSRTHHGSFYLRIGAVAFGVGSMIYSGLEVGQYFEIDVDSHCHDIFMAIAPATRMLFTFIQMYFIFLNSKMAVYRHRIVAHFGLMHMIATNLCIWLNIIIEETKHEILFGNHHHNSSHNPFLPSSTKLHTVHTTTLPDHVTATSPSINDTYGMDSVWNSAAEFLANLTQSAALAHEGESLHDKCGRSDVMGTLVQDASPFLFPCAIEYSLICAAILYVMWKNTVTGGDGSESLGGNAMRRRSRHHYSIDCAKANKGLFSGIFVLVMTIISLIVFFALINRENYKHIAIMEVNIARLALYLMTFVTISIGLYQHRELKFDALRSVDLDDILLLLGQTGVISYNMFTIIAARYKMDEQEDTTIELVTAVVAVLQALLQTLFILDASRRSVSSQGDQIKRKPGREVVTFLLVANFAMWTVNALEKSRTDVNPVQLQFYGLWPWIIIANVSMPLAIFYRFHSTVCLCEIWKRCYKAKRDYM